MLAFFPNPRSHLFCLFRFVDQTVPHFSRLPIYPLLPLFLDSWTEKPAFGTGLDEHLKRSGREIALPIEACVMMLLETGMKEEVREPKELFVVIKKNKIIIDRHKSV